MEVVRKPVVQRFMVVILIVALCFTWFIQPVKAIAIADDVAMALLVAALAAVGITAAATSMSELSSGLSGLLDEWEVGQGIESGTLIGTIANTAIALGSGAFQLGNTAWEKIQGFVDWLKGEKHLSEETRIEIGTAFATISYAGQVFPYISTSGTLNALYIDTSTGQRIYYNEPAQGTMYGVPLVTFSFNNGLKSLSYEYSNIPTLASSFYFSIYDNNEYYNVYELTGSTYRKVNKYAIWGVSKVGNTLVLVGCQNEDGVFAENVYVGKVGTAQRWEVDGEVQINQANGITLTQEYPDESEPLPYVPDLPLNVRIPGVTAGDLEGIAAGIAESVDAGDLEAVGAEGVDIGELQDYSVSLTSFFPFCIPFDVYHLISAFVAEPEAPYIEVPFTFSPEGAETDDMIVIDLEPFDDVARVLRSLELVLFCVGLALITRKVIRW